MLSQLITAVNKVISKSLAGPPREEEKADSPESRLSRSEQKEGFIERSYNNLAAKIEAEKKVWEGML